MSDPSTGQTQPRVPFAILPTRRLSYPATYAMDTARMAELLAPFVGEEMLTPGLLEQLQIYLDLLLRWNARVNLTAVRDPETIVTRHFGESLFAARILLRGGSEGVTLADVGSGAGFPGIPMKLFAPALQLTLIESHNKKAAFLREVRADPWGRGRSSLRRSCRAMDANRRRGNAARGRAI